MKLTLYKVLTQLIIILGRLRGRLDLDMVIRRDRTFEDPPHLFSVVCCDCGLSHFYPKEKGIRLSQPVRPKGYDYSWRRWAGESSEFREETEW